ncbi:MAG: hypothetical protein IPN39_14050 [Chitinophagaceae bacterium]|nr:hypothetical protein [Chitinophagaceae bacterium]HQV59886.1 hypothetical protein [Chitinophagaceae bacterium]HQV84320.1 hypothetical protein [Chitinophagaceae bacterium]HQX71588.1 hypothetical protein [Chitinophagaceae bacterium]
MKKISSNKPIVTASTGRLFSDYPASYFASSFLNFYICPDISFCSADAIQYISGFAAPYTEVSTTIQLPKLRL